jgi:long-chain acyl-CoA synthetase
MRTLTDDDLPLQRVYRWERERADRVFLTQPYGGGKVREWTWAEAMGQSRRMACYLRSQDWPPGSRVAILSKNCAWWMMADLAVWMAGHVSVPVYPSLRPQSVHQIVEHSDARLCFIGATDERESARTGVPNDVARIWFPTAGVADGPTWDDVMAACPPVSGNPTRGADDLATIIYTSGTTGVPKGVMHRFAGFRFLADAAASLLVLGEDERVLSYLPLAHIVERGGLEGLSLYLGWHVFFSEGLETFREDLQRAQPTIFLSVPRLMLKFQQGVFAKVPKHKLSRLLRIPVVNRSIKKRILHELGLNSVRHAACGAAPLPPDILLWYRNLGLNLMEGYGLTETMITHLPGPGEVRAGYVGRAFPGVECKIVEDGELLMRSPMNMLGYYKDPEATRNAFTEDGFFRTGDVAQIAPDGQLRIVGRVKEQFKTSKGKYVAPAPIESQLMSHPDVEACCLMGAGMPSPFAIVLLSEEARKRSAQDPAARKALEDSLRWKLEQVNARLDPHERVSFVTIVNGPWTIGNGFLTPTLKVKRNVLEGEYQAFVDYWSAQNRPVIWESAAA